MKYDLVRKSPYTAWANAIFAVDRVEDGVVTLIGDNDEISVKKSLLPASLAEGDVIRVLNTIIIIDNTLKRNRRERINSLMEELFEWKIKIRKKIVFYLE